MHGRFNASRSKRAPSASSPDAWRRPKVPNYWDDVGMRGDRVEIVVEAGSGVRTYEVVATRAGRRVEITQGRGVIEVAEVTRTGNAVRTARFMASRVIALVEHPSDGTAPAGA